MQKIDSGAEAVIYKGNGIVVKDRVGKRYRHPAIDLKLRRFRTRREAKVLHKLEELNFPAPRLVKADDSSARLVMEFIPGEKLKDVLHAAPEKYAFEVGRKIGSIHNAGIIHSDLTTSNMILKDAIYFIDFGLSFFSKKAEDKAVDLHLLERAFESKHHAIADICWQKSLEGYKETADNAEAVIKRLEKVEKRGRNK